MFLFSSNWNKRMGKKTEGKVLVENHLFWGWKSFALLIDWQKVYTHCKMDGGVKYNPFYYLKWHFSQKLSQLDVTERCVQIKDESSVWPCGYPEIHSICPPITIRNNVMWQQNCEFLLNVFASFCRKACGNLWIIYKCVRFIESKENSFHKTINHLTFTSGIDSWNAEFNICNWIEWNKWSQSIYIMIVQPWIHLPT